MPGSRGKTTYESSRIRNVVLLNMRKGGGRNKGNGFERQVAKLVVTAFDCMGVAKKDCYRTPGSGGHKYASKVDPGDLVISKRLRKYFPFHVECKFYRRVELWPLFTSIDKQKKAHKFKGWLAQTVRGNNGKLQPMLVWKENQGPIFCLVPQLMPLVTKIPNKLKTHYNGEVWYAMLFSDMLKALVKIAKEGVV